MYRSATDKDRFVVSFEVGRDLQQRLATREHRWQLAKNDCTSDNRSHAPLRGSSEESRCVNLLRVVSMFRGFFILRT